MNPAILNYLQQQNQTQDSNQMPATGQPMQGVMSQQQAPYNPFDIGISRAIDSARQSLGMTDKQQDKALRRSLLTFADSMSQQPKQRGFLNNFGSVSRALSPAIGAYDTAEEEALKGNNELANQILAYKAAEEAKQAQAEDRTWRRQHAESQLGEQRRYHDMMNSYNQQRLKGEQQGEASQFGPGFTPIENKAEVTAYAKDKKALGSTMKELNELEEKYKKFRKDYEGNYIDPMSAFSNIANPTKDFFGYVVPAGEFKDAHGVNCQLQVSVIRAKSKFIKTNEIKPIINKWAIRFKVRMFLKILMDKIFKDEEPLPFSVFAYSTDFVPYNCSLLPIEKKSSISCFP